MLLKSAEFAESTTAKKLFNLNDIGEEAEALLEEARRQGEEVLAGAQQEAEQIRQQAQEQGYREGYDRGMEEGREKGMGQALQEGREEYSRNSNDLIGAFRTFCDNFEQFKRGLLFQAEQNLVALAVAIAEKVVKKIGRREPQVTVANVKAALELINKTTDIVVKVSPHDLDHFNKMKGDESIFKQYSHISFEADEAMERGGCELFTAQGKVDGRLAIQMDRIADELLMSDQIRIEISDGIKNEAESGN